MNVRQSTLQALAYFDIFDYPLTFEQVYQYLPVSISKEALKKELKKNSAFKKTNNLYFLQKRTETVRIRKRREIFSRQKIRLAKKIAGLLSIIPSVYLIATSGALAMENCEEEDDVDLFVITKKGTLWSTRIALLFVLELLGHRRKKGEKHTKNKICLNMILDESALELSKNRRNLYGAHEIIQMIPLFERKNIYNRFIVSNNWCFSFLPNGTDITRLRYKDIKKKNHVISQYLSIIISFTEPLAKFVQKKYMGKITKEEISDNLLAFHPIDYQSKILSEYKRKVRALI